MIDSTTISSSARARPVYAAGNVYLNGAMPSAGEANSVVRAALDPEIEVAQENESVSLHITLDRSWQVPHTAPVTTERLGLAAVPEVAYENFDGTPRHPVVLP